MIDLKLDSRHDLFIKDRKLVLVEGVNQKAQQIKVVLLTFLGEWFLDTTIGVPYFDDILVKNPDSSRIQAIFHQKIRQVNGVQAVEQLTLHFNRQARELIVQFSARTNEGLIQDEVKVKRYG
ncbi:hypothetical protein [Gallibacterium salpingitidis]|uniref:Phage baseplate protein n=1 Tax=Gallibacterium salpingitidis TaxID=505341 RepID=A0A1A7NTI8_9PAST|nr:hypothetical protein [Gallibacterium salpingitidis]OBW92973.1 hypothetical protein QS62_07850 [Gallibacterium salpingitidis]